MYIKIVEFLQSRRYCSLKVAYTASAYIKKTTAQLTICICVTCFFHQRELL